MLTCVGGCFKFWAMTRIIECFHSPKYFLKKSKFQFTSTKKHPIDKQYCIFMFFISDIYHYVFGLHNWFLTYIFKRDFSLLVSTHAHYNRLSN